jgi:small-conductance mechanosensitive channel
MKISLRQCLSGTTIEFEGFLQGDYNEIMYMDVLVLCGKVAIVLGITLLCIWGKKRALQTFATLHPSKENVTIVGIFHKFLTPLILFVGLLMILQLLNVSITPLIALSSIAAAAFGLAGKDVLANLCGGFMLHLSRPFYIHDHIELPEKKISGDVQSIGWYFTILRDETKQLVSIPNALFASQVIVNRSD